MTKINYITTQNLNNISGGWSGINFNIYTYLNQKMEVNYVGPINPPMDILQKSNSKIFRMIGLKGSFSFFSEKRLSQINSLVSSQVIPTNYNLFFGQTPWIDCNLTCPYGVYMDADFLTYLKIYSNLSQYSKKDVLRIMSKEEKWLQKAQHVFVGSQWTWDEMVKNYELDELNKIVTWTGGNIEIPVKDNFSEELNFTFISLDFKNKGGTIAVEAFNKIKLRYPTASLKIIGQKPPEKFLQNKGVFYEGLLKKTDPKDYRKFKEILENSFLMIHPTTMDTMGAVIIESGYYGCPTIAPKSFGIPELIIQDKTGILVEHPLSSEVFAEKIIKLIEDREKYLKMRKEVRRHTTEMLTWETVGKKIENRIKDEHFNTGG